MQSYNELISKRRTLALEYAVSQRIDLIEKIRNIDRQLKYMDSLIEYRSRPCGNYDNGSNFILNV